MQNNALEKEVRKNAAKLRDVNKIINQLDQLVETDFIKAEDNAKVLLTIIADHDKICLNLKKSLESYFEYEQSQNIPRNFAFHKLYYKLFPKTTTQTKGNTRV